MRNHVAALVLFLTATFGGCGGGSEGTGTAVTTRSLEGAIRTSDGKPVANADVVIIDTGDSTRTDADGKFSVPAPLSTEQLTIEVSSNNFSRNVNLNNIENDATAINVSITIDENSNSIDVSNIQLWSRITGDCDRYFENRPIIRQSVKVDRALQCTMRFFVSGNGRRLERIRGEIQVRACNSHRWRAIADGQTGAGLNAGFGDIEFTFIDNNRNCEYRVVAPSDGAVSPLSVYLATLTLQSNGFK